ncbi:hypothetical protein BGZ83_005331, partial [Gryganskiella cystojenkinii]
LLYFSNAIINAIQEFSATERKKYPLHFPPKSTGQLYSDELLQKHLDNEEEEAIDGQKYLSEQNQRLEYWIQRAHVSYERRNQEDPWRYPSKILFTSGDLDLADVIKTLIIENDMVPVLTLVQHPLIPVKDLHLLHHGHSFGTDRLVDYCLNSYVYLNILAEFPELCQNRNYRSLKAFKGLEHLMSSTCDGDSQMPMHRSFYCDYDKDSKVQRGGNPYEFQVYPPYVPRDLFSDMRRMKEYLKLCFAVLYRYDMVVKENGKKFDWLGSIAGALNQFHFRFHQQIWIDREMPRDQRAARLDHEQNGSRCKIPGSGIKGRRVGDVQEH